MDFSDISQKTPEELFALLDSGARGLSGAQASTHSVAHGANTLPVKGAEWWRIALRQFRSSFVYLLLAACVISVVAGEYLDAALVFIFLVINATLGFFQEYHAEHSLRALKKIIARTAWVLRDGVKTKVPWDTIAVGDAVVCEAGDMIPADGYFFEAENIAVDESPLTGESAPVEKRAGPLDKKPALFDAANIGFANTTLISGKGLLLIFATGIATEGGKMASRLAVADEPSAFEIGISRFSAFVLKLVCITVPVVFIANMLMRGGNMNVGEFLVFLIALMVGVVPEALPLVTTLSLSKGALRLAKMHVVPRRLSAVEDLGSIQILCTDKTGTITENKLTVAEVRGDIHACADAGLMASVRFTEGAAHTEIVYDAALHAVADRDIIERVRHVKVLDGAAFDPVRRCESVLIEENGQRTLYVRGALEALAKNIPSAQKEEWEAWVQKEGGKGRRTLAIARLEVAHTVAHISAHDEAHAEILGCVSFTDPLKATARQAIKSATQLGVRIKILTGDSKEVAGWTAHEAGIINNPSDVVTGSEFDAMSLEDQLIAVDRCDVFARMLPLQKYRVIELLREKYFVGFLGEGFNDAPALKLAHVAIAVEGACDIAREASDVILLNQSLQVVVGGIREGRKIFANTFKYIKATLTSNFGNFYALAFASLAIDYLPMLPVQILLVNLLSDFPMISIAADAVDEEDLRRPAGYNVREIAFAAIALGLVSTAFDFLFFGLFVRQGAPTLHTMWFIGSILTELILLFSIRTSGWFFKAKAPSAVVITLTAAAAAVTIAIPFSSFGQRIFSFERPTASSLVFVLFLVGAYFVTTETVKVWGIRLFGTNGNNRARHATRSS